MATIAHPPVTRKSLRHYAHLGDLEGIARLVPGGYAFTADGERRTRLVAYTDPELILHGLVDDAPADPRPLWAICADPATYNGTYGRDLVRGR